MIGYIGIDLGSQGGLAMVGDIVIVKPLSDAKTNYQTIGQMYHTLQASCGKVCVGMEKVHGRSEQGSVSTFKWGVNCGQIYTILNILNIEYNEFMPQTWIKGLGLSSQTKGMSKGQRKGFYRETAKYYFPGVDITLKTSDALLIAKYMQVIGGSGLCQN